MNRKVYQKILWNCPFKHFRSLTDSINLLTTIGPIDVFCCRSIIGIEPVKVFLAIGAHLCTLQVEEQGEGIGCVESYGDQEIMIFDFAK
jgi:hypothetical protein